MHSPYFNMFTVAFVVVLVAFLIYIGDMCMEKFSTKREKAEYVQEKAYPIFYGGNHSYAKYKEIMPNADAVEYNDVRSLYKNNNFTADKIEQII